MYFLYGFVIGATLISLLAIVEEKIKQAQTNDLDKKKTSASMDA